VNVSLFLFVELFFGFLSPFLVCGVVVVVVLVGGGGGGGRRTC
jgi:hypothetical protein